jgi:hypothetical protein
LLNCRQSRKTTMTAQPMVLWGLSAWTKIASAARSITSQVAGSTYQSRYLPSSTSVKPRESWQRTAAATLTSTIAISTSAIASVFDTTYAQLGAGVASTISCTLRSRSRHTSSPA